MADADAIALAWAAGFFDGEGCTVSRYNKKGEAWRFIRLQIHNTNRSLLDRFQEAVGAGVVGGPYGPYKKNWRAQWAYHCNRREDIEAVMEKLWPYLGDEKKEQYKRKRDECLPTS